MSERFGLGMLRGEGAAPEVRLGAFGKHPAWDDHLDDQGLDTPELIEIKRVIYLEGMNGNIDAGTWEALAPGAAVEGFNHVFLARAPGGVIAGRFWSSTDGKGRSRYPMVVCAECSGLSVEFACRVVLSRLAQLEGECKLATSPGGVVAALETARADLAARAASAPPEGPRAVSATKRLADSDTLGPQRLGMHRVLYQLQRDMAAYRPLTGRSTAMFNRAAEARAQHLRVPQGLAPASEALLAWMYFCEEHLSRNAALLLIAPERERWLDVIVGDAETKDLFCVRAGEVAIPCASDIPYTLDDAFVREAQALIDRPVNQEAPSEPARPVRREPSPASGPARSPARPRKPLPLGLILGGVGAVGAVILGMVLLSSGGGSGSGESPEDDDGEKGSQGSGEDDQKPRLAGVELERWKRWCNDYEQWIRPLQRPDAINALRADPHLAGALVSVLQDPARLDPRSLSDRSGVRVVQLASEPPSKAATPEGIKRTRDVNDLLDGIRRDTQAAAWPARADLALVRERAGAMGWAGVSAGLAQLDAGLSLDAPADFVRSVSALARLSPALGEAAATLREFDRLAGALSASKIDVVQRFVETGRAAGTPAPESLADGLAAFNLDVRSAVEVGGRVERFLADGWTRVDHDVFARDAALGDGGPAPMRIAAIESWLVEARRDRYLALNPADDPRRTLATSISRAEKRLDEVMQACAGQERTEIATLSARLGAAKSRVQTLAEAPWTQGRRAEIVGGTQDVLASLASFESDLGLVQAECAGGFQALVDTLRGLDTISPSGSSAVDRAWAGHRDELLSVHSDESSFVALKRGADELRAFLIGVESDMPPVDAPVVPGVDAGQLRGAAGMAREAAIGQAIAGTPWRSLAFDVQDEAGRTARAQAATGLRDWAGHAKALAERVGRDVGALDARGELAESPRSVIAEWSASPAFASLHDALTEPLARVRAIEAISTSGDRQGLIHVALEESDPALCIAAWRRLGALGDWPTGIDELRADRRAGEHIAAVARTLGDAGRAAELAAEGGRVGAARWVSAMERAGSSDELDALARERPSEANAASLSARTRFNLEVRALRDAIGATAEGDDGAIRAQVSSFVAAQRGSGISRAWLDAGQAALDDDGSTAPAVDPVTLGPATVGWRGTSMDGGARLRFVQGSTSIEFIRIEPSPERGVDGPFYLAATELTIDQVNALVSGDEAWKSLEPTWVQLRDARTDSTTWTGIRSWGWSEAKEQLVPNERWLAKELGKPKVPIYAEGLAPLPPSGNSPLNWVSPTAALSLAGRAGCRLAAPAEYLAALDHHPTLNRNLRDSRWLRQLKRTVETQTQMIPSWPDTSVFVPMGSKFPSADKASPGETSDDGVLWIRDAESGNGVADLVGNLAELVGAPGADGRMSFGVVGGSALSPPELALDQVSAVSTISLGKGWSDVGVRFAFDAGAGTGKATLSARVRRWLSEAPFVMADTGRAGSK